MGHFVYAMIWIGISIWGIIEYTNEDCQEIKETPPNTEEVEMWIPTQEDILYQDSMYTIIRNTQNDVINIKEDIVHILERLDYVDGTYDSIRYVKGGKIDKKRNQ